MADLIISVSGLRGIVGQGLTPEVALRYACAFAATLPAGPIVISRDGRSTGSMLVDAIRSGLRAVGRTVIDAEIAATPTTGILVREFSAAGGIQVTASHNPAPYNGMKLFSAEGRVLSATAGQRVLDQYQSQPISWQSHAEVGELQQSSDTLDSHLKRVLATVNVERIRRRGFRVVLDSSHGSGSLLGLRLLRELGCTVTSLGGVPDGQFEHPPEPTAENLADLLSQVPRAAADLGFCQDPDADRLATIDASGHYVGEEYTLALCVDHVLRHTPGPVVTNCSTSRMTQDLSQRHGVPFFPSRVGEANVVQEMLARQAVLGGEGNGGVIDPRVGFVRDSFVAMALILDAMALHGSTLAQWVNQIPRYEMVKTKFAMPPEELPAGLRRLADHFPEAHANPMDGLRLDWPNKWLLVRGSNTEPIVRAIAEAPTLAEAQSLCDRAERLCAPTR